jgi:cation transport regulator
MTYLSNADLPPSVRNSLPSPAQDIYRTAFNNASENPANNPIEEADAHNIAWAAVERAYVKEGGEWVVRGVPL